MTPRDLRNIHTTGNSCRDALPCANMALKLPQYFYLLMQKPLGRYFQVRSPYYQARHCDQKNIYFYILKVTGHGCESQKRISIITNYSYHHQGSFPYTSLNGSNNKIRFSFNQANRKTSGVRLVEKTKHQDHKVFLLWYHHQIGGQPRLKKHLLPMK